MNNQVRVIKIEPNGIPKPDFIENDILKLNQLVNVDKHGNICKDFESFEITEIKDNINIISSPKAKERKLPLVRRVGRYTEFYGVMYIVKVDSMLNLVSLAHEESVDYCVKFLKEEITLESLGLPPVDYHDDEFDNEADDDYRRVSITFDD